PRATGRGVQRKPAWTSSDGVHLSLDREKNQQKGRLPAASSTAECVPSAFGAQPRDAAGLQEPAAPVAGVELRDGHVAAGARGMQEAALADVDANVVDALAAAAEEHQIARDQRGALDLLAILGHVARHARQLDAKRGPEHVADQAAAVEAA